MDKNELNIPNKDYYKPMHTAEHLLNQTMIRMFGCGRSPNAHIEQKKSKCDYTLNEAPSPDKIAEIEKRVNEAIDSDLPVKAEFMSRQEAAKLFDLSRLPSAAGETLCIVSIGDYDVCPCIGEHVENTAEIGHFKIISSDFENRRLRIRFKLINP
ncbi:MAG: hypothetical protein LBU55_05380 [Elusimicrobiota bacterium]|jgi:Ser-tRNA(Ala) deacylase AlaX|nr:hypothetical protein [Elusimicrobiota bacterium]